MSGWTEKPNDVVTVDLTLHCGEATDKEMRIIRPSGYYFYNDNLAMQVRNGVWKTRSVKVGSTIDLSVNVCGKIIPVLYKVNTYEIKDTLRDLNVCKCY
ncbi:MAG: hypothetical protein EOP56_04905 [Sphingobacteriales bacterium]|nr:MAG: hypothetical protein EOP56_04905 [Sphingobacteriales bacterium]